MRSLFDALDIETDLFGKVHKEQIMGSNGKLRVIRPGETVSLHLAGSGVIRRIWMIINAIGRNGADCQDQLAKNQEIYRRVILTLSFNETLKPQIDLPVSDFFLFGHGCIEDIDSRWIQNVRVPHLNASHFKVL